MKTRLTLRPGNKGTKAMERKYGAKLIAVRYHYDEVRRQRIKTVELIEDVVPWERRYPPTKIVTLRIDYQAEQEWRGLLLRAGAQWSGDRAEWRLDYASVVELGLTGCIVREPIPAYSVALIC